MQVDQQIPSTPKPTPFQGRSNYASAHLTPTPLGRFDLSTNPEQCLYLDSEAVIYGTSIKMNEAHREARHFLLNFEITIEKDDDFITQKPYLVKFAQLQRQRQKALTIDQFEVDGCHLHKYSEKLYIQLVYFPVEIITIFDRVLQDIYQKEFVQPETDTKTKTTMKQIKQSLKVGFINLYHKDRYCIKDLVPSMLGRLVELTGIVVRASEIYPEMKSAFFQCMRCGQEKLVNLEYGRVQQPDRCDRCHRHGMFQLKHNRSLFINRQYLKFQQQLQNISQGQSPASITLLAYDSGVDKVRPGDCVKISGIYRCSMSKITRGKEIYRAIFGTYFDVVSSRVMEGNDKRIKVGSQSFNQEYRKTFFKMANQHKVINKLAQSFAPGIFGHLQVKKGLLTQIFGGNRKKKRNGNQVRSQINICLVGDPGTAKSQFLQQVSRISPRCVYTCGRGSTSAGLTANIRKDPETKQFVLQSGALVLSDEGICCIDEFDKMNPKTHTTLLEVMEQQTISIAKAGIVCQLNSRTAILAAANPINSRYDQKKSVIENINMPPALLSRFDLIYIMLDKAMEEEDKKIANHILNMYTDKPKKAKKTGFYDLQVLADYITYARELEPILSQAAGQKIQKQYLRLRAQGQSNFTIAATPRMLQSLVRMSQAFAKMRLSNEVSAEDAEQAIDILNFATLKAATDPESGLIDMGMITTGKSTLMIKKIQQISFKIKVILLANESKYSKTTDVDQFQKDYKKMYSQAGFPVTREYIIDALKVLEGNSYIYFFNSYRGEKQAFKLQQFSE